MGKRGFKPRAKKDKFADLEEEFTNSIMSMSDDDVKRQVAKAALDLEELLQAKDRDDDLKEKGEAYRDAGAIYREGSKRARLKIAFCKKTLEDRGKDPTADTTITIRTMDGKTTGPVPLKQVQEKLDRARAGGA